MEIKANQETYVRIPTNLFSAITMAELDSYSTIFMVTANTVSSNPTFKTLYVFITNETR